MGAGGGSFGGSSYVPHEPTMPSEEKLAEMTPEEKEACLSRYEREMEARQKALAARRRKRIGKAILILVAVGLVVTVIALMAKCTVDNWPK